MLWEINSPLPFRSFVSDWLTAAAPVYSATSGSSAAAWTSRSPNPSSSGPCCAATSRTSTASSSGEAQPHALSVRTEHDVTSGVPGLPGEVFHGLALHAGGENMAPAEWLDGRGLQLHVPPALPQHHLRDLLQHFPVPGHGTRTWGRISKDSTEKSDTYYKSLNGSLAAEALGYFSDMDNKEEIMKNFIRFTLYIKDLTVEIAQQVPAYGLLDLLSDMGEYIVVLMGVGGGVSY